MIQATLERAERVERPRLSDILINDGSQGFDCMAAIPSNIRAIESALLFSSGVQTFAALVGPSGWGKSHLLEAAATRLSSGRSKVSVFTAEDWLSRGSRMDPTKPLVLDNVQDILAKKRLSVPLRLALERRVKAGRPTLLSFTAQKPSRQIKSFLPQTRDWVVAAIAEPARCERRLIIRQMSAAEGLILSDELITLLSKRVTGNGRTILGALKRLRLTRSRWVGERRTLEACGRLGAFFDGSSAWDLRDHIVETAEKSKTSVERQELIAYTMLRVALLPEAEVAGYLRVGQSEAYGQASHFEGRMRESEITTLEAQQFIQEVVRGL